MTSYAKFNAGGMAVFGLGFALVLAFIPYTMCVNPGPASSTEPTVAKPFSAKELSARTEGWMKTSPEAVDLGAKLYAVNCASCHTQNGQDQILGLLAEGKARVATSNIGLYNAVAKGIDGQHRFSYIGKQERWALTHYLQSKATGIKQNSSGEWQALIATDY